MTLRYYQTVSIDYLPQSIGSPTDCTRQSLSLHHLFLMVPHVLLILFLLAGGFMTGCVRTRSLMMVLIVLHSWPVSVFTIYSWLKGDGYVLPSGFSLLGLRPKEDGSSPKGGWFFDVGFSWFTLRFLPPTHILSTTRRYI